MRAHHYTSIDGMSYVVTKHHPQHLCAINCKVVFDTFTVNIYPGL